ncbi:MAG: pyridoxal-phosphate dependent enzyme [Polyangiaceae bacterium]|nr:pyridoxal-phosphate dependent enzyme [Polyangiaceae bacterium]
MKLGVYPTGVRALEALWTSSGELFVKDDGATHPEFGGNKVRKLEPILERAVAKGARRLVTLGAAGSHQAVATALFAKKLGLEAACALCPQPWSPHAFNMLRAAVALGIEVHPVEHGWQLPVATAKLLRRKDYLIPLGSTNVPGTRGYVAAAFELKAQIDAGELPEPDVIVVALGSGGTTAGLLAGLASAQVSSVVLGVTIAQLGPVTRPWLLGLAHQALRRDQRPPLGELNRRLVVENRFLGAGYAEPTVAGERAFEVALEQGLRLDLSYTAKAFAAALRLVDHPSLDGTRRPIPRPEVARPEGRPLRVLYWHTLSSAPIACLTAGASDILPDKLNRLLLAS